MPKYSEEANRLWPYLLKKIERVSGIGGAGGSSGSVGVGGAPSPHGLGGVHHTGTISNAQGPQFLLADGTRTLTGNLAVSGGITIDGVDLSAHAADPNAHHNAATAGNAAISLTGQAISLVVASSGGLQVSGAGVHIDLDSTPGLVLGSGGIKVLLDPTASGLQLTSGLALADSIAGAGLGIASKVLTVNVGDGMEIAADAVAVDLATNSGLTFSSGDLAMGTPTAVAVNSTNSVTTTTHTHAVTASSNVGTTPAEYILKSTPSGGLTLGSLTVTGAATVDQGLTAGSTGFRVIYHTHDYDHVHVAINPTGLWSLDEQFGLDIDDNLLVRGWIVGKHAIQVEGALMLCHYDGPGPYETNFKGNPTGHLGQPGRSSGGVVYRPGKFAKAVQMAPGTINHVTNPSFETGTTGWTHAQNGTGSALSQSSTRAYVGTYSAYMNGSSTGNASATSPTFNSISNWYTAVQARVWATAGTVVEVILYDHTAGVTRATATNTTTGEWELIRCAWFDNVGTQSCSVRVRIVGGGNGAECWFDAVQAERGATQNYISPYADGSMGGYNTSTGVPDDSGHTWSGTAHASTTTRVAADLYYPAVGNIQAEQGSVIAWVNVLDNVPSTAQYVLAHFNSGNRVYLYVGTNGNWWVGMGSSATLLDSGVAMVDNTWTFIALTWDGTTAKLYIDGGDGGIDDDPTASAAYSGLTTIGGSIRVGANSTGGETLNGWICELSILDRAMPGNEIRAVYESQAPIFAEASTWHWRAGRNRIYADSEGLWGYGASGGTILGLYAGDEANPSATKSWGGLNLAEGDFALGDANRGAFLQWDDSAGDLYIGSTGSNTSMIVLDSSDIYMLVNGTTRFRLSGTGYLKMNDVTSAERFSISDTGIMSIRDSGGAAVFTFNASAGAEFTKPLTLGTSGGIYQGTGTFASPTKGLKIWSESDGSNQIGRIAGYNGGTLQWGADTNGRLVAGGNNVILNSLGIRVIVGSTPIDDGSEMSQANAIKMVTSGGADVGWMTGAGTGHIALAAAPPTGESQLYLMANPQDISWGGGAVWPQITLDAGTTAGSVITLDGQDIFIGHSTSSPTDIVLRGQVNATDATFNVVGATGLITGSSLRATGDAGGAASTTTFTNVVNASANSTGVGSVKMKGATSRDSTGFIKIFVGTTAYYIPYWSAVTG